jgi:hypothetical protein
MPSRHLVCSAALLSCLAFTAQAQEAVPEAFVVRHARLELAVDFAATRLSGAMTLEMENWTPKPANSVSFVLNRLMEASQVRDGAGAALQYTQDVLRFRDSPKRQVTQIIVKLPKPIPPGARTTVRIDYAGYIAPYTEVGWLYVRDHIDTAFTIIRADAMAFPIVGGLSAAANGRTPFQDFTYDVSVRVPPKYIVATGGVASRTQHDDGTVTWHYVSMGASPFMDIAIAPFDTLVQRHVHVFYFPNDSVGARRLMARAQATLDTLTGWFGPLHSALNLTITEIPDGWGSSAHLVGGIIQTAAAFQDPTRLNELYHELTHLWNPPDIDNPSPRWNEGLASFLEDLLLERMDGWGKRAKSDSSRIAAMKKAIAGDSTLRRVPFINYGKQRMTDYAYSVGRLMFLTLHDLIGEEQFNQVVRVYSQQFAKGGTTQDLIRTANATTGRDLSSFFNDWMFTTNWTTRVLAASSITDLVAAYGGGAGAHHRRLTQPGGRQ